MFDLEEFKTMFESSGDKIAAIVSMARMAETAERYEDMCQCMQALVAERKGANGLLSVEERNLLSVAYKNVIGTRRASWRTLSAEAEQGSSVSASLSKDYQVIVERELVATCDEVIDILKELIPQAEKDPEATVFYLKMAGDYYRYLAESIEKNADYPQEAKNFYEKAHKVATADGPNGEPNLVPTHPIRLGLALNYSVCFYEILKNKEKACELAKSAFDDAIAKLDKLEESDYKDSTLIMQLLRDNLTLWNANQADDGHVEVEDLSDDEN